MSEPRWHLSSAQYEIDFREKVSVWFRFFVLFFIMRGFVRIGLQDSLCLSSSNLVTKVKESFYILHSKGFLEKVH